MKLATFALGLVCLAIALLCHLVSSPSYRTLFDQSAVFAMGAWLFFWDALETRAISDSSITRSLLFLSGFVFAGDIALVLTMTN